MSGLFDEIREVVKTIPKGKVATYGQVANLVGTKDARKVGWALHGNQNKSIPCHRVIRGDGTLAENFSLGGAKHQQELLEIDGVVFSTPKKVNLDKYLWQNA